VFFDTKIFSTLTPAPSTPNLDFLKIKSVQKVKTVCLFYKSGSDGFMYSADSLRAALGGKPKTIMIEVRNDVAQVIF
jgi:hypothetical protein